MSRHRQVTECLRGGICSVCGAYEGSLTTDCPGESVSFDKQQEVYETNLDFTDARGWHQGEPMKRRSPRFEQPMKQGTIKAPPSHLPLFYNDPPIAGIVGCSCGWRLPPGTTDSDDAFTRHAAIATLAPTLPPSHPVHAPLFTTSTPPGRTGLVQLIGCSCGWSTSPSDTFDVFAQHVEHSPLWTGHDASPGHAGVARLIGCSCGWQNEGATDSDATFVAHVGMALGIVAATSAPSINWAETECARIVALSNASFLSELIYLTMGQVVAGDGSGVIEAAYRQRADALLTNHPLDLKRELAQKASAWVQADRLCDDHSANLVRLEDEVKACMLQRKDQASDAQMLALLQQLERAKINFKIADQHAVKCDDEFRQAARKLVTAQEAEP